MINRKRQLFFLIFIFFILFTLLSFFEPLFGIPVLCYTRIVNDRIGISSEVLTTHDFEKQLQYLNEMQYTTITPAQLMNHLQYGKPLPDNPILLTFDEGYADHYRIVYPLLQKYKMTATFFVLTDKINKEPLYMTWKQLGEIQECGFQIASHSVSHPLLTKLSDQELFSQLFDSRNTLHEQLKTPTDYFSYPEGVYDMRVMLTVKKAGYRAAFTTNTGRVSKFAEPFALNRVLICKDDHHFYSFWLRLKFAHLFSTIQQIKSLLD